jgi:hypothetical protein
VVVLIQEDSMSKNVRVTKRVRHHRPARVYTIHDLRPGDHFRLIDSEQVYIVAGVQTWDGGGHGMGQYPGGVKIICTDGSYIKTDYWTPCDKRVEIVWHQDGLDKEIVLPKT